MNKYEMLRKLKNSKHNTQFDFFVKVIKKFGFEEIKKRKSGSHIYNFILIEINERLNIQPKKGKAKIYQVEQFLNIIEIYNL